MRNGGLFRRCHLCTSAAIVATLATLATITACFHTEYKAVKDLQTEYQACVAEHSRASFECESVYIRYQDAQRAYEESTEEFLSDERERP